ncbi:MULTISPECIES: DMT family transporter [unclassified Pseudomonas]|uniref:DMT family transporter n=1 Tax=unclassified Pseudomonas TaxID=196821 RepID=UPI001F59B09D|nr:MULTISPECIES: DMT family transporter [unclassified Pseudomonas]
MTTLHWVGLLALAVIAGAVVPFQSAINANLGRGLGHPLWATLASLLVNIIVLLPVILAMRLPLPSLAFITKAPLWMWAGGAPTDNAPRTGALLLMGGVVLIQFSSAPARAWATAG